MFNQVTIIGCGLIGSSVLRSLKKNGSIKKLVSYDKDKSVIEIIKKINISDEIASDLSESVKNSDLVLISTPISSFEEIISSIKNNLKPGSILTDTCSVKKGVNETVKKMNLKNSTWIPAHPVAGTENSGPNAGVANLFKDKWTILTPSKNVQERDIKKVSAFWELMGSKVKIMSVEDHDKILSLTSHLPHVIAYNIVKTTMGNNEKIKNDIIRYSAGGLRDFTRIAASNPVMWRDIFIQNRENTAKMIDKFIGNLKDLKKAIKSKNEKKLEKIFIKTKKIRKEIIEAGQDIGKPDFGRK